MIINRGGKYFCDHSQLQRQGNSLVRAGKEYEMTEFQTAEKPTKQGVTITRNGWSCPKCHHVFYEHLHPLPPLTPGQVEHGSGT